MILNNFTIYGKFEWPDGGVHNVPDYFPNIDFESGDITILDTEGTIPDGQDAGEGDIYDLDGWTIYRRRVIAGQTIIEGYPCPVDTNIPINSPGDDSSLVEHFFRAEYSSDVPLNLGTRSIELKNNGTIGNAYGILRGPYIVNKSVLRIIEGDVVSFWWRPTGGGDAYEVLSYLLNTTTGEIITMVNEFGGNTNATTSWTKISHTITAEEAGDYKFIFICGSHDYTGGKYVGASMLVKNLEVIRVTDTGDSGANLVCRIYDKEMKLLNKTEMNIKHGQDYQINLGDYREFRDSVSDIFFATFVMYSQVFLDYGLDEKDSILVLEDKDDPTVEHIDTIVITGEQRKDYFLRQNFLIGKTNATSYKFAHTLEEIPTPQEKQIIIPILIDKIYENNVDIFSNKYSTFYVLYKENVYMATSPKLNECLFKIEEDGNYQIKTYSRYRFWINTNNLDENYDTQSEMILRIMDFEIKNSEIIINSIDTIVYAKFNRIVKIEVPEFIFNSILINSDTHPHFEKREEDKMIYAKLVDSQTQVLEHDFGKIIVKCQVGDILDW